MPPLRLNVHASLLAAVGVAASETGLPLVVVAGERTDADAALVWSWGRVVVNPYTGPLPGKPFGDVATNARTVGDTAHGRRGDGVAHALDVHPDETRGARRTVANYTRLGEVWRRRGLLWGGDFTVGTTRDWPHVETRLWRQLPPKGTT